MERPVPAPCSGRLPVRLRRGLLLLLLALCCVSAAGEDRSKQADDAPGLAILIQPDPSLAAAEVLEIQLRALQANDRPRIDSGIAQNWLLAHPRNKAGSGPYSRFADMLRSPAYAALIDHRRHRVAVERESAGNMRFLVLVETRSGDLLGYRWTMEKVSAGRRARCWMTTGVSLPILLGELT